MSAVLVVCPRCGKELKLRDRSKLGQKGKCPGCGKPFLLRDAAPPEEEEVPLELAEEAPEGVGARWVPDEPAPSSSLARAAAVSAPATAVREAAPAAPAFDPSAPLLNVGGDDPIARLKELKRRNAKRRNWAILAGLLTALAVGGAVWGLRSRLEPSDPREELAGAAPAGAQSPAMATATGGAVPPAGVPANATKLQMPAAYNNPQGGIVLPHQSLVPSRLQENGMLVAQELPQRGEPIRLRMVPSGVNLVFHLRPAQLWSDEPEWQELRYSLTEDVTNWLAGKLKELCRREPQQIEECLICVRLGATGTEPDVSAVVRFAQEEKLSDLIEEFRGDPLNEDGGPRINIASPYAYLIADTRTIAIAPESAAFELQEYMQRANPNTTSGIDRILDLTDRERVFTAVFEMDDVKRHEEWLFSERSLPVFRHALNWFGDDVETVAWSVDLHNGRAASDLVLRTRPVAHASRLAKDMVTRLEALPQDLVAACRKMTPATKGFQAFIGRYPAMIEAFRQATIPSSESRHVRLTTILPRKAAPNLALGTMLTWDESTRTDFSSATAPQMAAAQPAENLPEKVIDRLKLTMEGEINGPFQDAIAYIADSAKVQIDIDGNALKDAGFTKNMPQKYSLGQVTALDVLKAIVEGNRPPSPDKRLAIVIDEANKSVLVTTEAFAAAAGQEIYPFVTE